MNDLVTKDTNVMSIIAEAALKPDLNPGVMEKLLEMQERVLDRNAKQSFNADFVRCQGTMPAVVKDTANNQTNSTYAKLETINKHLLPHITQHGFALSFGTADSPMENYVRVIAELIHREGHCKEYFYDCPHDGEGIKGTTNKTPAHARASALTYGERYLTTMIFNIIVMKDDDGNAANSVQNYTDEQWSMFNEAIDPNNPQALTFAALDNAFAENIGSMRSRHLEAFRASKGITTESNRLRDLIREGHKIADDYASQMKELVLSDDLDGITQLVSELTVDEKKIVNAHLDGNTIYQIEQLNKAA